MKQEVNYIKHQKAVFEKMAEDDLSPLHISMYNALFYIWNDSMFDSELNIYRNEIMNFSKIKNVTTYTNTLRDLEKFGYLKYNPSHNPLKCSKVTMYTFGHSGVTTTVTTTVQSGGNTTVHTDATIYKLNKLINEQTIKLINDNASLVNDCLHDWINNHEKIDVSPRKELFNKFWDYYNVKEDRKKCEALFMKLKESDLDKMRATLPNYIARTGGDTPKFRKNPFKYLNGEMWNDEKDEKPITPTYPNYAP